MIVASINFKLVGGKIPSRVKKFVWENSKNNNFIKKGKKYILFEYSHFPSKFRIWTSKIDLQIFTPLTLLELLIIFNNLIECFAKNLNNFHPLVIFSITSKIVEFSHYCSIKKVWEEIFHSRKKMKKIKLNEVVNEKLCDIIKKKVKYNGNSFKSFFISTCHHQHIPALNIQHIA